MSRIIISPKIQRWLLACKEHLVESGGLESEIVYISKMILGEIPFTQSLYFAMPFRPDAVRSNGDINVEGLPFVRKSFEEELKELGSGLY